MSPRRSTRIPRSPRHSWKRHNRSSQAAEKGPSASLAPSAAGSHLDLLEPPAGFPSGALQPTTGAPGLQALEEPVGSEAERPGVEDDVVVGDHEDADGDQEDSGRALHRGDEGAVALEEAEEAPEGDRGEKERDAEAGGVGEEERDALLHGRLAARERQDGAENGADARRPADGEGEADGEGADEARGLALDVQLLAPPEETDAQHPRDVQPEDHDEGAARNADPVAVVEQELAGSAEGRAEADEDGGEAGDERDGVEQH